MPQHDYSLANAAGAAFRSDANDALGAIVTLNSGASAPATTFARMFWADTTTGLLKIRNASNTDWVTVGTMASANLGLVVPSDIALMVEEFGGTYVPALVKRKTADESVVSSTTLQDDDHLTFPIGANEEWVIEYAIKIGSSGTLNQMGLKFSINGPSGHDVRMTAMLSEVSGDVAPFSVHGKNSQTPNGTTVISAANFSATSAGNLLMRAWVLNGATPGDVKLQWAQVTSHANQLVFTKGSHMVAHRVA